MGTARATRVLVVANRTAATPRLLQEIERRSKGGTCEFALLVPPTSGRHPDWTLDVALSHVEQAAGQRVQTVGCDRDYIGAVRRALSEQPYDEASPLPLHSSRSSSPIGAGATSTARGRAVMS
jgi:hypothetical protein